MNTHTPGPWKIHENRYPYKDGSKSHVERLIVTKHDDPQLKGPYPVVGMSVGIGLDGGRGVQFVHINEANARLIAAAPELLAALTYCRQKISYMETHGEWYSPGRAIEMADAAIAKATGVKP